LIYVNIRGITEARKRDVSEVRTGIRREKGSSSHLSTFVTFNFFFLKQNRGKKEKRKEGGRGKGEVEKSCIPLVCCALTACLRSA
jgi:hypothetical protein